MDTVRSLIDDGLMVIGNIDGGSDERVEPWDLSLDDAMARICDEYVVHHEDRNWIWRTWFALTDRGERAAEALGTGISGTYVDMTDEHEISGHDAASATRSYAKVFSATFR